MNGRDLLQRPCTRPRQYLTAVTVGAGAASVATALEGFAAVGPNMLDMMPIALLFAVPIGALAGTLSLSAGLLSGRLLRSSANPKAPALASGIGTLVVGLALTVAIAELIPPFTPFAWAPTLACVLGAGAVYIQSSATPYSKRG